MLEIPNQCEFWDEEAPAARFSHPLNERWLRQVATPDSRILDFGCGYGRTLAELQYLGYRNLIGLDVSARMLERARSTVSGVPLVHAIEFPCPLEDGSVDLILLLAVLTSIPQDDLQERVMKEVLRLLRPGGHLYVSDLPLQKDARRVARYVEARPAGLSYGTFEIDGGKAVMRHHPRERFDELFMAFRLVEEAEIPVATMRGRIADTVQFLLARD